jgi:hypothetical protein
MCLKKAGWGNIPRTRNNIPLHNPTDKQTHITMEESSTHLYEATVEGHADAVLVTFIAHFGKFTIRQMKDYLAGRGIPVRL